MMRKDGSRKLKSDAVATIFGENFPTSITRQNTMTEAAEIDMFENAANEMEEEIEINEEDITVEEKNDVLGILSNRTETSDPCVLQRLEKLEMLWKKSERLRLQMKKKLQQAKRKIKRLQTEVRNKKITSNINKIFNEDQLCLLSAKYKKIPKWCNSTLIKACRLKFACGYCRLRGIVKSKFPSSFSSHFK